MQTMQTIASRRSIRRFSARPVGRGMLKEIVDAARLAPSATNRQFLRYIVVTEKELLQRLFALTRWGAAVAPRRSPQWGKDAPPALIAVTAPDVSLPHIGADAGAAIENMLLAAHDQGLGSCWLGAFDREKCDTLLALRERTTLYLVAVGYPAESPQSENCTDLARTCYYLDDENVLHVPKLDESILVEWR